MKYLRPYLLFMLLFLASFSLVAGCGGGGPDVTVGPGGISQGDALDGLMARTQQALSRVNSVESAQRANQDLVRINQDYDDLLYHMTKLNPEGRREMSKKAAGALPGLQDMADQIHGMPALDDILGETLDEMVEKLVLVQ